MQYSCSLLLTVKQQHPVLSADRPNGHEFVCVALPVTSISAQLLILQGVDEYQCTVSATYTDSIMGCSLAAVADMSHLHSARKKNTLVWSMRSC